MKRWSARSLWLVSMICLPSAPSLAQVAVETYTGTQQITMNMPGIQMGDSIEFSGLLKFTTLQFTPGPVTYEDTLIDFSGNEFIFISADYPIVLKFPDQPGAVVTAAGTWTVVSLAINGSLEWQNIELGPGFSTTSFDVVQFSSFTSLVSEVLWSGPVIPELAGNIISIDGAHTITGVNPAGGVVDVSADGTIYAEPDPSTGIGDPPLFPGTVLRQNYPNPFNPKTAIQFDLPRGVRVDLSIFDVSGEHIVSLVDGFVGAGPMEFHWDGRDSDGRFVGSGIYFYRLRTTDAVLTKKMVLLK